MPDEPEAAGLLALMLLDTRRATRTTPAGGSSSSPTRTAPGGTAPWSPRVRSSCAAARPDQPGPYQLQAAINAVHSDARRGHTDWGQIVALYDQLMRSRRPRRALNRAIAVAEAADRRPAGLVDGLDLDDYRPFHATRAEPRPARTR